MRAVLSALVLCISICLSAQHDDWLPEGAVLGFAQGYFFYPPPTDEIGEHRVVDAYFEDGADVRLLEWVYCGCPTLPESFEENPYRLHRRGDRVYYYRPLDSTEYLLYDYGAQPGDTLSVIAGFFPEPGYAGIKVVDVVQEQFGDTVLDVQKVDWFLDDFHTSGFAYQDVIIGLVSTSYIFPEAQYCDPLCGGLSYYRYGDEKICFDPLTCFDDDLDFPYSPVAPNRTYYFMGQYGRYHALANQLDLRPGDIIECVPTSSFVYSGDECIQSEGSGWVYSRMEIISDSLLKFYNLENEAITVELNKPVGERWLAYANDSDTVFAEVSEYDPQVVQLQNDTLMCVVFDHVTDSQSALNDMEFCISLNFGLQSIISFVHFPDYGDARFLYEELQQFNKIGDQETWFDFLGANSLNLNWTGAMALQPGDEIHVKETELSAYGDGYVNLDKLVYIGRQVVAGGEEFRWNRERRHYYNLVDSLYEDRRDTFVQFLSAQDKVFGPLGRLPGTSIQSFDDPMTGMHSYGSFFNARIAKSIYPPYLFQSYDTCWQQIIDGVAYDMQPTWIQGLAGPYYTGIGGPGGYFSERVIKYYNKVQGEEWGEPCDFTVSTNDAVVEFGIRLYPNPAADILYIDLEDVQTFDMKLINSAGQMQFNQECNASDGIDISSFPAGVYYYEIITKQGRTTGKLVIAR